MKLNALTAISPIDGRYRRQVEALAPYFSEFGLIQYRVRIEIEYFIALCELPLPQLQSFDKQLYAPLRKIYTDFTEADALHIKETEAITNHDVKAVEYLLKRNLSNWESLPSRSLSILALLPRTSTTRPFRCCSRKPCKRK